MSITSKNRRQSCRHNVRGLNYVVTFADQKNTVNAEVLDFSASGMRVVIPIEVSLPNSGRLLYRGDLFRYEIKHEVPGETEKFLGLEIEGISTSPRELGHFVRTQKHISRQTMMRHLRGMFLFLCVCVLVSVVCFLTVKRSPVRTSVSLQWVGQAWSSGMDGIRQGIDVVLKPLKRNVTTPPLAHALPELPQSQDLEVKNSAMTSKEAESATKGEVPLSSKFFRKRAKQENNDTLVKPVSESHE